LREQSGSLLNMYVGSYPIALQSDGKIIFAYLASDTLVHLIRLNADGSVDGSFIETTFAADVLQTFPVVYDPVTETTLQPPDGAFILAKNPFSDAKVLPDGTIVIVGAFTSFRGLASRGIIRLRPNGAIDDQFSIGGGAQWIKTIETPTFFPSVD